MREHRDVGERGFVDLRSKCGRRGPPVPTHRPAHGREWPGAVTGSGDPGRLVRTVTAECGLADRTGHRDAIGIERKIGDAMLLANIRPASGRVAKQPLVELFAGTARFAAAARRRRAAAKSAKRSCRRPVMKVAPHFCGKPALRTTSSAPMASRRGSRTRAAIRRCESAETGRVRSSTTARPARVSHAAAVEPAGPPPMTTTSQSNDIRIEGA